MGSLRTLLAIAVVFAHTSGGGFVGGRNAVQLFYIISGFLISYILVEVRSYKTIGAFYVNRYLRLFPIYISVAALTLIAYIIAGEPAFFETYEKAPLTAGLVIAFANATLFLQDWIMFLGVRSGHLQFVKSFYASDLLLYLGLLAHQAWTLGLELTFYLFAPFLMKSRLLIWLALGLSLALRLIFIVKGFGLTDPWTYRFFPTELALFLCGSLSHQLLLKRYRALSADRLVLVSRWSTIFMLILCVVYPVLPTPETFNTLFLLGMFIFVVPAMFEFQGRNKWDNEIGKLSYPIYICHMLVLWVVVHSLNYFNLNNPARVTVVTVIGSVILAFVLDRLVGARVEAIRSKIRARTSRAQRHVAGVPTPGNAS